MITEYEEYKDPSSPPPGFRILEDNEDVKVNDIFFSKTTKNWIRVDNQACFGKKVSDNNVVYKRVVEKWATPLQFFFSIGPILGIDLRTKLIEKTPMRELDEFLASLDPSFC